MRARSPFITILSAFICLTAGCATGAEVGAPPNVLSSAQIGAIRSAMVTKLEREGIPGATIAIGIGDRVVWSEGFGLADVENQVRATSETAYRSASIGKSMTATAAVTLAEAGRLDLDSPIQRYCPRFPVKEWPITTRQLLSHTAGIRHYQEISEDAETFLTRHYDDALSPLEIFEGDPLLFEPGQQQVYSTWGYVLLGCVIQGAAEEPYLAYMQRSVFGPSGMTHTRDDDPRALIENRARGYVRVDGRLQNSRFADMSGKLAAGGFITTAPDLARFGLAFANDRLVSARGRDEMLAETQLANGDTVNYGFGWLVNNHHGVRYIAHGGGTPQVSGMLLVAPEAHVSIALLFNLENTPERESFATQLLDLILDAETDD